MGNAHVNHYFLDKIPGHLGFRRGVGGEGFRTRLLTEKSLRWRWCCSDNGSRRVVRAGGHCLPGGFYLEVVGSLSMRRRA